MNHKVLCEEDPDRCQSVPTCSRPGCFCSDITDRKQKKTLSFPRRGRKRRQRMLSWAEGSDLKADVRLRPLGGAHGA